MSSLHERVAFVTGSTSGIGLAIAWKLARAGANVALNGFGDPHEIESLRVAMETETGRRVLYGPADMSRPDEIDAAIASIENEVGPCDVVVNNAGIQHTAPVHEFPIDVWQKIVAVNLTSAFVTTRRTLPGMLARGWGRIVNVASVHGLVASAHKAAYVAAKHGLVGLTKVTALETAGTGVTANAICPGWVRTPLVEKQIDALAAERGIPKDTAVKELLEKKQPSQAFVTTDQVGDLVLFLCSEPAAQMTGVALPIDGGWTAQ